LNKNNIKPIASHLSKLIDGNLSTSVNINKINGSAQCSIEFLQTKKLKLLSIKLNCNSRVQILLYDNKGGVVYRNFLNNKCNYILQTISLSELDIAKIGLISDDPFSIFEIAAMDNNPKTEITIDFKEDKPVGWITTKHYAGEKVIRLELLGRADKGKWNKITDLDPTALNPVVTRFDKNIPLRYLKFVYHLDTKIYSKAFLWEVQVYDNNGPYGDLPIFKKSQQTLKESFGINGFWGWGSKKHIDKIAKDNPPFIFSCLTHNLRYYHNMDWDVSSPDIKPDFNNMSIGSLNNKWLNWDREYMPLKSKGYNIIASVQFSNVFNDTSWKTPYQSAFEYGKAFGAHFGDKGNNAIQEVEIGNEPWKYSIEIYRKILLGMSEGIKSSAPSMKVFPCAFDVDNGHIDLHNNILNRLSEKELSVIDGINTHLYPYTYNKKGERYATFPENPESGLRRILAIIKYRDKYLSGKPIYLTEYGWDSSVDGKNCTHKECVSEDAQAVYAIRSLLMLYRLGIDKMYWFFFTDEDKTSFQFTRSGLLTSPENGMNKKRSYYALQQLMDFVGESKLIDVIREDANAWEYLFRDSNNNEYIIAWTPKKYNRTDRQFISINKKYKIKEAYLLSGYQNNKVILPISISNKYEITSTPTIFLIK